MNLLGAWTFQLRTYCLDGVDVSDLSDKQLAHVRNRQIGFIFQGFNLIPPSRAGKCGVPLIYQGIRGERPLTSAPWKRWKRFT
jgi:ABC-type lipoprotein export system ATPase subunit